MDSYCKSEAAIEEIRAYLETMQDYPPDIKGEYVIL